MFTEGVKVVMCRGIELHLCKLVCIKCILLTWTRPTRCCGLSCPVQSFPQDQNLKFGPFDVLISLYAHLPDITNWVHEHGQFCTSYAGTVWDSRYYIINMWHPWNVNIINSGQGSIFSCALRLKIVIESMNGANWQYVTSWNIKARDDRTRGKSMEGHRRRSKLVGCG